ncbi:MAG: cytochrome c biogenesis protein CcsA [Sandaracinaceae bacterium]|nr:cytochrome c biogenesis protein CcsA [Sandaracinaceae bacterium]
MIVSALFLVTASLYAIACVLYFIYTLRGEESLGSRAPAALFLAILSHVAFLVGDYAVAGHIPTTNIQQTLAVASLLIAIGYLVAMRKHKLAALGAFITPLTLLFLLGAGFGSNIAQVPAGVRSIILPLHVGVNILGIVAFALAFAVSIAYLLQERLLLTKRLGGVFQRLPPLHELDSLGFRLVTIGFPLLTIGIVSGAFFAARIDEAGSTFSMSHLTAYLAWIFFAAVLVLRIAAGWRGRRAAIGTMLGFFCAILVLVGYALRGMSGAA